MGFVKFFFQLAARIKSGKIATKIPVQSFIKAVCGFLRLKIKKSSEKYLTKAHDRVILSKQQAEVAELADALDSKSGGLWSCGFDSHLRYHLLFDPVQPNGIFFLPAWNIFRIVLKFN